MSDEPATVVESGVSTETHRIVADELTAARSQLALLKAKTEVYDAQKREVLSGMKSNVAGFINDIEKDPEFDAFKHELAPMSRWADKMELGDSLETNLSIGRLVSCASAKYKRTREEASAMGEKSNALAAAYKELEEVKSDRDSKATRIGELEGLVDERTGAAQQLQDELAKAGLIKDKIDFSNQSARENVGSTSSAARPSLNVEDALLGFINSGPSAGGLRVTQSSTGHSYLGSTGGDIYTNALSSNR